MIREHLMPVEGRDGVLFPATYAASEERDGFKGGYNIDSLGNGKNVCLVDSVGSQANRIEPIFAAGTYASLVPQVVIVAGTHEVNLLEAGHRAGDAIVRCSSLQEELQLGFGCCICRQHARSGEDCSDVAGLWCLGLAQYTDEAAPPTCVDDSGLRCSPIDAFGDVRPAYTVCRRETA